jgi:tRNA threonylcarbamoyladenosine biosynthesis protein TsaB
MKRLILGLETSGEHQSAALIEALDGGPGGFRLLGEVRVLRRAGAPDVLLELVASLTARAAIGVADLALIAVGRGPGGFTGVRIGLAVAQGLSLASAVPVWPVSTLAALALNAIVPGSEVLCLIDARRGEVYAGAYRLRASAAPETLLAPRALTWDAAVQATGERMVRLGSGALAYGVGDVAWSPAAHVASATAVAELALYEWRAAGWDAENAPAVDAAYLRKAEAEIAADRREAEGMPGGQ